MKKLILFILLLSINTQSFAGHFPEFPPFPVTSIEAHTVMQGDEVFFGYAPGRYPCLMSGSNIEGETEYIEINGNNIEITVIAWGGWPCFDLDTDLIAYEFYNLGIFAAGVYNVQMYWSDKSTPLPAPSNLRLPIGETVQFKVLAPVIIPSLTIFTLLILGVIIMTIALFNLKKVKRLTVLCLFTVLFWQNAHAKTFHILLSPTGVSAEDVMKQSQISPAPPGWLLSSFNTSPPVSIRFLVPERPKANGNLQNLLDTHPNWSLARLYQFLIVNYADDVDENQILTNFNNDINIETAAYITNDDYVLAAASIATKVTTNNQLNIQDKRQPKLSTAKGFSTNFLTDLNINSAWELSEGMGYIAILDLGLQLEHPDFKAFDNSGNYLGGNLLGGYYQIDYGRVGFGVVELNIDEAEPTDICWKTGEDENGDDICANPFYNSLKPCDAQDGVVDNIATIAFIGHGTHVAGITSGKNHTIGGICKNCGLSMLKTSIFDFCSFYNNQRILSPRLHDAAIINTYKTAAQFGVGTINISAGKSVQNENYCDEEDNPDSIGFCIALDFVREQNVMMVNSAGNNRILLTFPGSEIGTISVGGLMKQLINSAEKLLYWNESPTNGNIFNLDNDDGCPRSGGRECGSNISLEVPSQNIDVVAQAKNVKSTFYFGLEWADDIGCTDYQDGIVDGYGNCTGTSMAAPQIAGVVQLMRSANPLLSNGTYDPSKTDGLINVLNASASHSDETMSPGFNDYYGYGLPNARKALEIILGKSNGVQMKTRLTPMFINISSGVNNNHFYTPFPQLAMAFLILDELYVPDTTVPLVSEFTEFWYDRVSQPPLSFPAPRAKFYIFTTNNNPFTGTKNMIPLRRMDKTVAGNRNDTYAVSTAEIEAFHTDSYNYAGIEGYILPTCSPTPSCIPTGAIALYRDETDNLNHKLIPTNTAPANSVLLGYVYLNQDTDGDGLIDGQEIILGTNINLADTDGDGMSDSFEYPPADVPFSDPLISDIIFEDGFE